MKKFIAALVLCVFGFASVSVADMGETGTISIGGQSIPIVVGAFEYINGEAVQFDDCSAEFFRGRDLAALVGGPCALVDSLIYPPLVHFFRLEDSDPILEEE